MVLVLSSVLLLVVVLCLVSALVVVNLMLVLLLLLPFVSIASCVFMKLQYRRSESFVFSDRECVLLLVNRGVIPGIFFHHRRSRFGAAVACSCWSEQRMPGDKASPLFPCFGLRESGLGGAVGCSCWLEQRLSGDKASPLFPLPISEGIDMFGCPPLIF